MVDLHRHQKLESLQFYLGLGEEDSRDEEREAVVKWFKSVCETVTSQSLKIEVSGLPHQWYSCSEIEEVLLALSKKVKELHVRVDEEFYYAEEIFPKLHRDGILMVENRDTDW